MLEKVLQSGNVPELKEGSEFVLESDLEELKKVLAETSQWFKEKIKAQHQLADNEDPVLIVPDLKEKVKSNF